MLLQTLLYTVQQYKLILPEMRVLVAVSGGADSLALLHALHDLSRVTSGDNKSPVLDCELYVATYNHGLRGADGAADAQFVRDMAEQWGLPVMVGAGDVQHLANIHGIGIESAARIARYAFLVEVAQQVQADVIATAHHADDQAETIMMHIIRGAGTQGLTGMAYVRDVPGHAGWRLIRPLLDVTRTQIEQYCAEHNLQPRTDATNFDMTYWRNAIRHQLMPQLRDYNPNIVSALRQLADVAATEQDYMQQQFDEVVLPRLSLSDGAVQFDSRWFHNLHPAMQRWLARWLLGRFDMDAAFHIIEALVQRLRNHHQPLVTIDGLPVSLQVMTCGDEVVVMRMGAIHPVATAYWHMKSGEVIAVAVPGDVVVVPDDGYASWRMQVRLHHDERVDARLAMPPDAQVQLRTRQPGDTVQPLGMGGRSRKLKSWMIDRKIPQSLRDTIPLLVVDGQIAAIILKGDWMIADPFAVHADSARVVYFALYG